LGDETPPLTLATPYTTAADPLPKIYLKSASPGLLWLSSPSLPARVKIVNAMAVAAAISVGFDLKVLHLRFAHNFFILLHSFVSCEAIIIIKNVVSP